MTAQRMEDRAVIVVKDVVSGHQCDGPADKVQRLIVPVLLLPQNAQHVQRTGMIGPCGEDLAVCSLRGSNLAALMLADPVLERLVRLHNHFPYRVLLDIFIAA